ncbi:lysozyme inhibitor LprI family protein [Undibacterium sp. Di27W]|uniref:lysozyme inhibitor LprI family protein n=1 Tax=Undibacterium sp. Di27W TaxID=3413036 RepID=UPI003BF3F19E
MQIRHIKQLISSAILACTSITLSAAAASFDCDRAATAVEKAICADPALSALDDQLGVLYGELLKLAKDRAAISRMQHEWIAADSNLSGNRSTCEEKNEGREACLAEVYRKRLDLLAALKPLMEKPDQPAEEGWRFDLHKVSTRYDFSIRMLNKCDADKKDDSVTCEEAGVVYISEKGQTTPLQVIPLNNIFLSLYKTAPVSPNRPAVYGEQGTILVGDFNFDGEEDIAIRNGNFSSYSGPSYDVLLKSRKQDGFVYSEPMTNLILGSLGIFQVGEQYQRLSTAEKSGCCYHVFTQYRVVNDIPVPVSRKIDDGLVEGKYNYLYEEQWVNNKWKRVKTERIRKLK